MRERVVRQLPAAALALVLSACAIHPVHAPVPDDLAAASHPLEVAGRQGWMFNRHLAFGGWRADGVNFQHARQKVEHCEPRCWGFGIGKWSGQFDDAVLTAKSPLTFAWHAPGGDTWRVRALAQIRQEDHVWLEKWGRWSMASGSRVEQASFAGDILPEADASTSPGWHFVLWTSSGGPGATTLGWLEDAAGRHFDLELMHGFADETNQPVRLPAGLPDPESGYTFVDAAHRHVAACDTLADGRVWLREDLAGDDAAAITATCAALLLRMPVGQEFGASAR